MTAEEYNAMTFDAERHEYRIDGAVVPSVTQIVSGVMPPRWLVDEWYLTRGAMTHRAIALLLAGRLDMASVDERIAGFVEAARNAIRELNINPAVLGDNRTAVELQCWSRRLRFAGTLDCLTDHDALVDWKSGTQQPEVEIQLGGYVQLCGEGGIRVKNCLAIELNESGTYAMTRFDPARCKALFMAALSIYGWMEKHGINKKEERT